ncbi:hypothetical protein MTO96_010037 [Rhipicephalus appendiculatus]
MHCKRSYSSVVTRRYRRPRIGPFAEQQGATATTFVDARERLLFSASQDFIAYSQKLVVGAVFDENGTCVGCHSFRVFGR